MKNYLLLIVLFIFMGCASINFAPVTHPDQRILFEGFSFLPPNGDNWEMTTDPIEANLTWENWGRGTIKRKAFKKSIVGPTQKSGEAEIWIAQITYFHFGVMKFDHDDDLMELVQEDYNSLDHRGIGLLESNFSIEKINGMNCVRSKGKAEGAREISYFEALATTIYMQGFICVYPRHPNHLIELWAEQSVLKGHTPTDIQNELDHFFNSLQFH